MSQTSLHNEIRFDRNVKLEEILKTTDDTDLVFSLKLI